MLCLLPSFCHGVPSKAAGALPTQPTSCPGPCFCQGRCVLWPRQGNCAQQISASSRSSAVLVRSVTGQCRGRTPCPATARALPTQSGPARVARQLRRGCPGLASAASQSRVPCPTTFVCCACPPVLQLLSTADDPGGVTWATAGRLTRRVERPTRSVLHSNDCSPPTKPPLGCPMHATSVCVILLRGRRIASKPPYRSALPGAWSGLPCSGSFSPMTSEHVTGHPPNRHEGVPPNHTPRRGTSCRLGGPPWL